MVETMAEAKAYTYSELVEMAGRWHSDIQRDYPYKTSKGFYKWGDITEYMVNIVAGKLGRGDLTPSIVCEAALEGTVYEVDTPLLRTFQDAGNVDEKVLDGIDLPVDAGFFLFKQNAFKVGNNILSSFPIAGVTFLYRQNRNILTPEGDRTFVATALQYGYEDGELNYIDFTYPTSISHLENLSNTIFQLWLYSLFGEPEEVTKESANRGKGSSRKPKKQKFWRPKPLALTKVKYSRNRNAIATGTHASPRTHIRKGHWRNQPKGEGRKERELVWIRPCAVNA